MTLQKKIENRIEEWEDTEDFFRGVIRTKKDIIDDLKWVLSELEKVNCKNCKHNNIQNGVCSDYMNLYFCSNFEIKSS